MAGLILLVLIGMTLMAVSLVLGVWTWNFLPVGAFGLLLVLLGFKNMTDRAILLERRRWFHPSKAADTEPDAPIGKK